MKKQMKKYTKQIQEHYKTTK